MNGVDDMNVVEHPMQLDHPDETTIVNQSKSHLIALTKASHYANSVCYGISTDIYQFCYDPVDCWNKGHIFNGNYSEDLTFEGMVQASDASNKRDAAFLVHETGQRDAIVRMMDISLKLHHDGIMRPLIAGYNTQTSKFISAFRVPQPALTLSDWLAAKRKEGSSSPSIPQEVQQLLGTAYEAIMMLWEAGYTSDFLDKPHSYHMIGDKIKINLLCFRDKIGDQDDEMLIRGAFGKMILEHIYYVWKDNELYDFVDLVNNQNASVLDILGAPIFLLPETRELMYHTFDNAEPVDSAKIWLEANANPADGWKDTAKNADPILKKIIEFQLANDSNFSTDFKGAMHFASVVTAHYPQHFRDSAEAESGETLQGRVDSLLKKVLPRLLTKRYNSKYQRDVPAHQAPQQDDLAAHEAPQQDDLAAHQAPQQE